MESLPLANQQLFVFAYKLNLVAPDSVDEDAEEFNWMTARDRQARKNQIKMTTERTAAALIWRHKPPWDIYMVLQAIIRNITKIKNINHNKLITNSHITRIHELLEILYTSYYRSGTKPLFISKTHRSLQWLQHKDYEYAHVISCLLGGKNLLDMKRVRLKKFFKDLSTSLKCQKGQYGGICAIANPVKNQWEIFWIKYHPPQQEYIIRAFEFSAFNEIEIFLNTVHCLQRSVINLLGIDNNSLDFTLLRLIRHWWTVGLVGGDVLCDERRLRFRAKYISAKNLLKIVSPSQIVSNVFRTYRNEWRDCTEWKGIEKKYFESGFKLFGFNIEHCLPIAFMSLVIYMLIIDGWKFDCRPVVAWFTVIYSPRNLKLLEIKMNEQYSKIYGRFVNEVTQQATKRISDPQEIWNVVQGLIKKSLCQKVVPAENGLFETYFTYLQRSFKNLEFPSPICNEFVKVASRLLLLE